ncbi:hypothetical protein AMELA_G00012090 [Ameiurus melas]|uniref:Uncharacterized protein n=1 Tax=Ameiurus melas TaxID=219545 RepID=A0A7J6BL17_AMEME|nr:hypothetical protein AMELA_G00012090 [Ameiurus melas]
MDPSNSHHLRQLIGPSLLFANKLGPVILTATSFCASNRAYEFITFGRVALSPALKLESRVICLQISMSFQLHMFPSTLMFVAP